jgi:hypothetical protein
VKISYHDFYDVLQTVSAPMSDPLPIVRYEQDDGFVPAGLPRAAAEARLAADCFLTAGIRGLATPAVGAFGVGYLVWNKPHCRPLALPAAMLGALGGWGLGVFGAGVDGVRGTALACAAGGNIVYEAGQVIIGATREVMESLQRHSGGQVGPVDNVNPVPVEPVAPIEPQPNAVAGRSSAASTGREPVPVEARLRNVNPGAPQAPRHDKVQP